MKSTLLKSGLVLAMLLACKGLSATKFEANILESEWLVDTSVFECHLVQGIPYFGDAVFIQRAGESQQFILTSDEPRLKTGQAALTSTKPNWKKHGRDKNLGYVSVKQGIQPINLGPQMSQRVLSELHQGMEVTFTRRPWYGAEKSINVSMTSVNFRPAYQKFLSCQAGLLPANFEQIERSSIYFGSSKEALLPSEVRKLDNIGIYVKADPSVTAFYVDGHTDSVGARQENFELSRERAEMVVDFLIARGIPSEAIVTRWHGERYPVASNQTRKGRAQNRRVTIRLVKGEEPIRPEVEPDQEELEDSGSDNSLASITN
ncbi:flagellar protein MotY [Aurantivibrio infirmus]